MPSRAGAWTPPLRAALVAGVTLAATGAGAATAGRLLLAAADALGAAGPGRFEDAVTVGAAAVAIPLLAWLGLAVSVTAAAAAVPRRPGRPPGGVLRSASERVAPAAMRRVVTALVGATVVGLSAPALAQAGTGLDPGWPAHVAAVQVDGRAARPAPMSTRLTVPGSTVEATWAAEQSPPPAAGLDPGWVPERPPPAPRPTTPLPGAAMRTGLLADPEVVVRRGDTLWDIAARRLGPLAPDAWIAAEWPRWYAANRAVIGPDPDRLTPGQRLRPPAPEPAARDNHPYEERTVRR